MVVGLRNMTTLAQSNKVLDEVRIQRQCCKLDDHVQSFFIGLDWNFEGGRFRHEFLRERPSGQ